MPFQGSRQLLLRSFHFARWLGIKRQIAMAPAADFHFVRDYSRVVTTLMAKYPIDEAMSKAVGGGFEHYGAIQCAILRQAGLGDGMSLIDFGCGSGRLASALAKEPIRIDYFGIDIEQRLLDYAKAKAPPHFRFALNHALRIPAPDRSADMVCAFSVFTHLQHTETFLYLQDIWRVLRPGGRLVFSFVEFDQPLHWPIFEESVEVERRHSIGHLNQFIERNVIELWCRKLNYDLEEYIPSNAEPFGNIGPLGQSAMIVRRRQAGEKSASARDTHLLQVGG